MEIIRKMCKVCHLFLTISLLVKKHIGLQGKDSFLSSRLRRGILGFKEVMLPIVVNSVRRSNA